MKKYIIRKKKSSTGSTGLGGIKPFVDYLKYKLHLPFILKDFGDKLWGYKFWALTLVLICRPQLGAKSIAGLKEKLLSRFISRLFYIQYSAKVDKNTPKRKASIDILYDLFAKLDAQKIKRAMDNHIKRMRRESKVCSEIDLVTDSFIIKLSVKSLSKSRFEKIGRVKIRNQFYTGFKVFIGIDLSTKTILYIEFCTIGTSDAKKLKPIVKKALSLGFKVRSAIFDRGFWSGKNFKFLQRKKIKFYTVLKEYTSEFKALIRKVNSRTAGRRRLKPGVWVTEVEPISLPNYLKTKRLRCFVIRMRGKEPCAVITNDESVDASFAVSFYFRRNKVEKVIQELIDDYSICKLPRSAFEENAAFVYLTIWSYNLFLDFKMEIFGTSATEILKKKLTTLIRQIIAIPAVVRYFKKGIILEFEKPPPLMRKVLSVLT